MGYAAWEHGVFGEQFAAGGWGKIPNSKSQNPNKFQLPNPKSRTEFLSFSRESVAGH